MAWMVFNVIYTIINLIGFIYIKLYCFLYAKTIDEALVLPKLRSDLAGANYHPFTKFLMWLTLLLVFWPALVLYYVLLFILCLTLVSITLTKESIKTWRYKWEHRKK